MVCITITMRLVIKVVKTKNSCLVGVMWFLKKDLELFSNITKLLDKSRATNIITRTKRNGKVNVSFELSEVIGSILVFTGLTMVSALVISILSRFCLVFSRAFFRLVRLLCTAARLFFAAS